MLNPILNINNFKNISFRSKKNLHTKKVEDLTFGEKIEILRKYGLSKEQVIFLSRQSSAYINQFIEAKRNRAKTDTAFIFASMSAEEFQRAQVLISQEAYIECIPEILELKGQHAQKAEYLIRKKVTTSNAIEIAKLEGKKFERALELIKAKTPAHKVVELASLDDEQYCKALRLAKMGTPVHQILLMIDRQNRYYNDGFLFNLMQKGISFHIATNCENNKIYNEYLTKGYSQKTSAILTSASFFDELTKEEIQTAANIIQTIEKNSNQSKDSAMVIIQFLNRHRTKKDSLKNLESYISKIDFKKIKEQAPHMIGYSNEELIKFIDWHYKNQTQEFDKTALDIHNLTSYLENNHLSATQLDELLVAHPLARREVGQIPNEWFNGTQEEKETVTKNIYKAIKDFQGRKDSKILEERLSEILKKKTKVEKIGSGAFGIAYKINIENCTPVCLKVFRTAEIATPIMKHGASYEVQTGLFLNTHSKDFVHMIFGKVATKYTKDGFLVTQYLDEKTSPQKNERILPGYNIVYNDNRDENRINGTIIDYGSTTISST